MEAITETMSQEQPYEKFMHFGAEALTEAELLAVILRTGTRNCSALELAEKVLSLARGREKGLNALHHIPLRELLKIQSCRYVWQENRLPQHFPLIHRIQ